MILLLLACADPEPVDTAPVAEEEQEYTGCEGPLSLEILGPEAPVVGDEWTVWMWCDDALLTGTMRLRFDPAALATVEDNVATFLEAGEGTMYYQVGAHRLDQAITVGE